MTAGQNHEVRDAVAVQVEAVSKSFPLDGRSLPVLAEVNLTVRQGEFVSVIGPSGCGKSTLLNIIAGLEDPASGAVSLDGQLATKRLGSVAYMPQKDLLLPWRTVLGNVVLGLEVQRVPHREAESRAQALIGQFGLEGFAHQYPDSLSGGMRQRAALLRTVLTGKPIMLLDEPFGALDALTRSELQAWLLELWKTMDRTVVLVTHDVEEALLLSDRIYVMTPRPGRVKHEFAVPLPRPRRYDLVGDPAFTSLKASLLETLRGPSP